MVHVWQTPLWKMVAAWKKRVGAQALELLRKERRSPDRPESVGPANEPIGRSALQSFWQREYWDTFMRYEEQERKSIRYIENNPVNAKLCGAAENWPSNSARFRDEYRRLVLPVK